MKLLTRSVLIWIAYVAIASTSSTAQGAEKLQQIILEESVVELPAGERASFDFEVDKALGDEESVLFLDAWLNAKEPAGFSGALKVYLDGTEVSLIGERPKVIETAAGGTIPAYTSHGGWLLAYGRDPEELRNLPEDSVYRIVNDSFDITRFVFILPNLSKGKHTVAFESLTKETGVPISLRNIIWKEVE